jgi:hypothetical protein
MTPTTFAEVALPVAARGYRPFPGHQHSKKPAMKGWPGLNRAPWDSQDLAAATSDYRPEENFCCCLAIPPEVVAYDLDILDPDHAAAATAIADGILGPTPLVRIGNAPKNIRIYRNAGGIRSSKQHPLETFAGSGQVIGFGWHAETRQPYWWPHASPLTMDVNCSDIPAVALAQHERFRRELFAVVPRRSLSNRMDAVGASHTIGDRLRMLAIMKGCWKLAAAQVLSEAVEGNRNTTAWTIVASAAARCIPVDVVWELFRRHFKGWGGFSEQDLESAIERMRTSPRKPNMTFSDAFILETNSATRR